MEGICLLVQLLAVSLSHLHHIYTVLPFSQSACSFTSEFTSSNSTGCAANIDAHLNASIDIFLGLHYKFTYIWYREWKSQQAQLLLSTSLQQL